MGDGVGDEAEGVSELGEDEGKEEGVVIGDNLADAGGGDGVTEMGEVRVGE